jgi:hypothetical protein
MISHRRGLQVLHAGKLLVQGLDEVTCLSFRLVAVGSLVAVDRQLTSGLLLRRVWRVFSK